jgi:hypothetical protein
MQEKPKREQSSCASGQTKTAQLGSDGAAEADAEGEVAKNCAEVFAMKNIGADCDSMDKSECDEAVSFASSQSGGYRLRHELTKDCPLVLRSNIPPSIHRFA